MRTSSGHHGRGHGGHGHDKTARDRGERTRARRGDVRTAILMLLADQPRHGYQIMQAIAESTAGAWQPSPGAIYPTIAHLQDEGLITSAEEDGRKVLSLTEAGRRETGERAARRGDPFAGFATDPTGLALSASMESLTAAVEQVRRLASPDQLQQADDVLQHARRALYLLLAGHDHQAR